MKKYIGKGMLVAAALLTSSITTSVMGMDFMVPNLGMWDVYDDTPAIPQQAVVPQPAHDIDHHAVVKNFIDTIAEPMSDALFGSKDGTVPPTMTKADVQIFLNNHGDEITAAQESALSLNSFDSMEYTNYIQDFLSKINNIIKI